MPQDITHILQIMIAPEPLRQLQILWAYRLHESTMNTLGPFTNMVYIWSHYR